jgi:BirA family transcriptional regulator, biotin operon repressor / biotin---[acetyl-CoA-carboxylase] ligase
MGVLASPLVWYDDLPSTNSEALAMAESGVPEGWTVGAERQSAGRGRHGRAWASPPGAGIYVSIVLRPPAHAVSLLTLAAGVGVADGIQAASGADARVKWPNDVYLGSSPVTGKVAGILAEGGVSGTHVDHVVVGIGINVQPAALPPDVARRATSVEGELGRPVDRGAIFAEVCAGVWQRYRQLVAGDAGGVLDAWRARGAATLGRRVEWDDASGAGRGVAKDVDASGALVVQTAAGLVSVSSGEVRWT